MKLESLPRYFSPKSMMPGAVPCGLSADTLTITDVMATLGLVSSKASVGIELYLAKAGVLAPDNIIAYIKQLALQRAERYVALRKMEETDRKKFLVTLAHYVFRDYSLSAASLVTCSSCAGTCFITAEVFTTKVTSPRVDVPQWAKDARMVIPDQWYTRRDVREQVRVICKSCNGKGHVKNECRCRGAVKFWTRKSQNYRVCLFIKNARGVRGVAILA